MSSVFFDFRTKTWGRGSIFLTDTALVRINHVGSMANVERGISERARLLESFLDTCESIMARHSAQLEIAGNPTEYVATQLLLKKCIG